MTNSESAAASSNFPPTQWTLVRRAGDPDSLHQTALDDLLRTYVPVLQRYLVGVMRLSGHEAEDLVQGFVARRILEQRLLDRAEPGRGRFRSFLLKCFLNHVRDEMRKDRAAKRGPAATHVVSLDAHDVPLADPRDLQQDFDALWARQALSAALERMSRECGEKGRDDVWGIFEQRILTPLFSDSPPRPYEDLVADFGLKSPSQASNLLITAKRAFQRALEETIRETVSDEADIADEIAALKRALANSNR